MVKMEVTNLPANRIVDMDRRGVPWRIYKEIFNIVNIHYKKDNIYSKWEFRFRALWDLYT